MVQILKRRSFLTGLAFGLSLLILLGAATGVARWAQIRSGDRHGTGIYGQASDGTGTNTHYAKFDANGSLTEGGTGAAQLHAITFSIDGGGSAITTGAIGQFPTANFACTINTAMASSDQSGSITVDIWKAAGAIPASGNKISASAPVTLSSAQLNQASSLSGWTTSVSAGDVFGGTVASASTVQKVTVQLWCQ